MESETDMFLGEEETTPVSSKLILGVHLILVRRLLRSVERVHRDEGSRVSLPYVVDVFRHPRLERKGRRRGEKEKEKFKDRTTR